MAQEPDCTLKPFTELILCSATVHIASALTAAKVHISSKV